MIRIAWLGVALAIAGCGTVAATPRPAHAPLREVREHGLTVELPRGWQVATENLTPDLVDPREELSVATFPLRYRPTACAHVPGSALEDLGPGDAFVSLQERGLDPGSTWADFPARPARPTEPTRRSIGSSTRVWVDTGDVSVMP